MSIMSYFLSGRVLSRRHHKNIKRFSRLGIAQPVLDWSLSQSSQQQVSPVGSIDDTLIERMERRRHVVPSSRLQNKILV